VFKTFLPPQLRQGSFDKWVLFGTKSKHCESIAEEMSDKIEVEKFMEIWDFVAKDKFSPLFVDYTAPLDFMFKRGFDQLVVFQHSDDDVQIQDDA
jgi:hypothetical protein